LTTESSAKSAFSAKWHLNSCGNNVSWASGWIFENLAEGIGLRRLSYTCTACFSKKAEFEQKSRRNLCEVNYLHVPEGSWDKFWQNVVKYRVINNFPVPPCSWDKLGQTWDKRAGRMAAFRLDRVDQELGRDYYRREEAGGGVEHSESGLFADVGDVAEVPGDEIVDLVKGGEGDVDTLLGG
jgi:hypothetical protein